jgi:hypothetical protein
MEKKEDIEIYKKNLTIKQVYEIMKFYIEEEPNLKF